MRYISIDYLVKLLLSRIQRIMELLCDGDCFSQSELQSAVQLSEYQAREAVAFLTKYGFAEMTQGKVRVSNAAKELFSPANLLF